MAIKWRIDTDGSPHSVRWVEVATCQGERREVPRCRRDPRSVAGRQAASAATLPARVGELHHSLLAFFNNQRPRLIIAQCNYGRALCLAEPCHKAIQGRSKTRLAAFSRFPSSVRPTSCSPQLLFQVQERYQRGPCS